MPLRNASMVRLATFVRNQDGTIAVIFAAFCAVLVTAIGLAVDYSRMNNARSQLQNAADTAALEASILYAGGEPKYETMAKAMFDANVGELGDVKIESVVVSPPVADRVTVTARAQVPMTVLGFVGIKQKPVSVVAQANIGASETVEVALVVDHSRSLQIYGVYDELVAALKVFRDEVGADGDNLDNLYVSFIPFSGPVNVGPDKVSWLLNGPGSKFKPANWSGCVMARASDDETDTLPNGKGGFDPFLWPSEPIYNNWANANAADFRDIRYNNNMSQGELGPNAGCSNVMVPLSNKLSDLSGAISLYEQTIVTRVGTFPVQAMAWGNRALSPKWKGRWGKPTPNKLPSSSGKKYLIFLSDGEPQWNEIYADKKIPGHYSAYGWVDENRLGIKDPRSRSEIVSEMQKRFLKACDSAKANNITVVTIGYAMSAANAAYMKDCASGTANYYPGVTAKEIEPLFKKLAKEVASFRFKSRLTQ